MERLVQENLKNTPEEYDRKYFERKKAGVDEFDLKRWKLLLKYYKGGTLVDLGCLDSLVPVMAREKEKKAEIWGIDIAKEALWDMEKQHPHIFFHNADVYDTKFPERYFKYAVAGELIEHLEKPEEFIEEAFRILKKGGILALSTPFNEKLGEVDAERHLWSFTINDIRNLLEPYGETKIILFPKLHIPLTTYHHKNILSWTTKQ